MSNPVKVLIVDDDTSILALLDEVLCRDESIAVRTLSNSAYACQVLEEEPFDLLISDLVMPEVDGLQLLEHARATQPGILVVIITGYASLETTLEAIHAGVYDYITKPFKLEEFQLLVSNAAAHIQLRREVEMLRRERILVEKRQADLEETLRTRDSELLRLREELRRRQDLDMQTGTGMPDTGTQRLFSYQRMLETAEERYERQLRRLEELFSSGRLDSAEFELARQNLKTMI
jgi:DNA-binding NtrC family response regulator